MDDFNPPGILIESLSNINNNSLNVSSIWKFFLL